MFKNLKVGTKLLAVALAPLLVLVVLAGLGIRERLDEAQQAEAVESQARLAAVDNSLVHELQRERVYSAWLMAAATAGASEESLASIRADLDEQRVRTDEAMAEAAPLIGDTAGADDAMSASMTATSGRLDDLAVVRQSVDANQVDASVALDIYAQTIALVLDLNEGISEVTQDPSLAVPLQDSVTLARLAEAEGALSGLITNVLVRGDVTEAEVEQMTTLVDEAELQDGRLRESSDAGTKTLVRNKQARSDVADAQALQDQILAAAAAGGDLDGVEVEQWADASFRRLDAYQEIQGEVVGQVIATTGDQAASAQQAVRLYVLGALAATLLAVLLAIIVGRATTGPLRELTKAADVLSTERLPRLVEDLKAPGDDEAVRMEVEPIEIRSTDEIGQLAVAFNKMQEVTADVAEEQSVLLRKGIGDIFVNLARRNQALLDRQIEFIDGLEANEEDPDQLEHLFKLDHLATRMRRNAESLLVLAGAEPPRRRARPVALADVVRVAVGEVEDFTRITLLALDEVTVGGNVAVDLAHLLSELMENATHFSPPETRVEVVGHRTRDDGYIISVADQGIGMSAEQLAEANQLMAEPPLVGLALSRSLGFIVIGRLAARFGISVRLTTSPSGGVTALVGLPPTLVGDAAASAVPVTANGASSAGSAPAAAPPSAPPPPPPPPTAGGVPATPMGVEGLPTRAPGATWGSPTPGPVPAASGGIAPPTLHDALPQGDAFEQGLASLLAPGGPGSPGSVPPGPAPQAPPGPEQAPQVPSADDLFSNPSPAPPAPPMPSAPASPPPPIADPSPSGPPPSGDDPWATGGPTSGEPVPTGWPDLGAAPPADGGGNGAFPPAAAPPPAAPAAPEWLPDDDFQAPVPTDDPLVAGPSASTPAAPAFPDGLDPFAAPPASNSNGNGSPAADPLATFAAAPAPTPPPPPPPPAPAQAAPPPPPPPPPPPGGEAAPSLPQWLADPQPGAEAPPSAPRGARLTPAGLVQRTPRATLPNRDEDEGPAVAPTQRSPEEVRAMLSRYRTGLQRGRGPGDGAGAGEPTPNDSTWEGR